MVNFGGHFKKGYLRSNYPVHLNPPHLAYYSKIQPNLGLLGLPLIYRIILNLPCIIWIGQTPGLDYLTILLL